MHGLIDSKEREVEFILNGNILDVVDKKETLDLKFEINPLATFVSGYYDGRSATLRISQESDAVFVSGFYNGHLNDFRIFYKADGVQFYGYVNGYWTNVLFSIDSFSILMKGKLMNQTVDFVVDGRNLDLSNLIEFIIFGFYLPGVNLF